MNGSFLLDTNIVIAILNQETTFIERLTGINAFVPSIALGELYFGAYKSARVELNLKRIEDFLIGYRMLACDKATADIYGQIKVKLEAKGRPLPENDIWIAAIAVQYGLKLVTRDEHFREVDGLMVERW